MYSGVTGRDYKVKTVSGKEIKVFVAHPVDRQDEEVMKLTTAANIQYNCHGLSLNLQHVRLANGSSVNCSLLDPPSTQTLLAQQYETKTAEQAKTDLAAGKRAVLVFYGKPKDKDGKVADYPPSAVHSIVLTSIVLKADKSLDMEKSKCDSKNGFNGLVRNESAKSIYDMYSKSEFHTLDFTFFKGLK